MTIPKVSDKGLTITVKWTIIVAIVGFTFRLAYQDYAALKARTSNLESATQSATVSADLRYQEVSLKLDAVKSTSVNVDKKLDRLIEILVPRRVAQEAETP